MTTQIMAGRNIAQETTGSQYATSTPAMPRVGSKWKGLLERMEQVYWRLSVEVEPLFGGFFAPFTAAVRNCRLLSSQEKAELEALMKKR